MLERVDSPAPVTAATISPVDVLTIRALMPTNAASGYTVDFARRPLWLLRGEDRTGRNDFAIGHRAPVA